MSAAEGPSQRIRVRRRGDPVSVIRHQAVAQQPDTALLGPFADQVEVETPVGVGEENRLAVHAALGEVVRHIRQGPHWQPGRDIPPYRPVEDFDDWRPVRGPLSLRSREQIYGVLMGVCLVLIISAWTVVRLFSVGAAVVMSAVAAVIPPFAVMVANMRGRE